jgi:DNA repair exonuclease SbcCD nuclease subunit
MGKKIINILHLSDLHFNLFEEEDAATSRDELLDELINQLNEVIRTDKTWAPDYIVVSGDITYNSDPTEYEYAKVFFNKVLDSIRPYNKLSLKNFIICPGNHDKKRNAKDKEIARIVENKKKNANSDLVKKLDPIQLNRISKNRLYKQFKSFNEFAAKLYNLKDETDYTNQTFFFPKIKPVICFVVINSALLCVHSKIDCGKLAIDKNRIAELYKKVIHTKRQNDNLIVVTVIHHNPGWLNWNYRYETNSTLDKIISFSDIILTGHEHCVKPIPDHIENKSQLIYGGATFDAGNKLSNNFNLLKVNPLEGTFQIRFFLYDPRNINTNEKWKEISQKGIQYQFRRNPDKNINFTSAQIELEIFEDIVFKGRLRAKIDEQFINEIQTC